MSFVIRHEAMSGFIHFSLSIYNLALGSEFSGKQPLEGKIATFFTLGT